MAMTVTQSANSSAARLYRRDIQDLDAASNKLAAAAETIRRFKPAWAEIVVTQLVEANEIVERIRIKGAKAYARFYERQGAQDPAGDTPAEPGAVSSPCDVPARQDEEEGR